MEEGRSVESLDISASKSTGRQWYFCKSEALTARLSNLHHMFSVIIPRDHNNAVNNVFNNAFNNKDYAINNTVNNAFFSSTIKVSIPLCV